MGATHAITGVLAWSGVAVISHQLGYPMQSTDLLVGNILCAGAAMLPDIDHPGSTVARAYRPFSLVASRLVRCASRQLYARTRWAADEQRDGSHRGITHTILGATLFGGIASGVGSSGHPRWILVVLFALLGVGMRGVWMKTCRRKGDGWTLGVTCAATAGAWYMVGGRAGHWDWLGLPVAIGALTHCLGDSLTTSGCPLLWPLVITGRRWYPVHLLGPLKFTTGGRVETKFVYGCFVLAAIIVTGIAAVSAVTYFPHGHGLSVT
jgi:membrane-bound metal-dependent hydrolase YbcI (DUF457 family)